MLEFFSIVTYFISLDKYFIAGKKLALLYMYWGLTSKIKYMSTDILQ